MNTRKILVFIFLLLGIGLFYFLGLHQELKLERIQFRLEELQDFQSKNPATTLSVFMGIYVLITSLSIPGAIILTLLAGTLFGVWKGTFIVTVACTLGATLSFFISRLLLREVVLRRFRNQFFRINQMFVREGNVYLFTLRMIPVSPFVVINLLMGLTPIKPWSYIWITFVGMLPGNFIYVVAGQRLAEIKSPDEILTWPVIFLLALIGLLPFLLRKSFSFRRERFD